MIQKIVGTLLYYACTVDLNMMSDLITLIEEQANPTQNTESAINFFLEYAFTNLSTIVQYKDNDRILHNYSDASYL